MMSNTLIIGAVFIVLNILSIAGWVVSYQHEGTLWQLLFGTLLWISVAGLGVCFITAIVILISGG